MAGAQVALWVPCLVLAHAFAIFWLVRAYLLARAQLLINRNTRLHDNKLLRGSSSASLSASLQSVSSSGVSTLDVEARCAVCNPRPAAATGGYAAANDSQSTCSACGSSAALHQPAGACGVVPKALTSISPHAAHRRAQGSGEASLELQFNDAQEALTVEWQALGCSHSVNCSTKVVLQDVWGMAQPGQMQALMGPSGAGKSTLMDMLAMRKSLGTLTGRLLVNGQPATTNFIRRTSYVPQENTFIPTMTCQETLVFYAGVTLGDSWSRGCRKARVAAVLSSVGLSEAASTLVGGVLPGGLSLRGLSGGETRRLSIAAGILAAPSVLYLDEPTSGLDSFAALSVIGHLQQVAQATQQTVIATIHQPRSAIWEMFDTVSLLASGRLLFHGPCADMVPWFQGLGYTYTKGSEADWVLDLVATGFDKPVHLFGHTLRDTSEVHAAAGAFHDCYIKGALSVSDHSKRVASNTSLGTCSARGLSSIMATSTPGAALLPAGQLTYPTTWWRQFRALMTRELAGMTRNPFDVAARVLTFIYVALLFGLMAYDVPFQGVEGFRSRNNVLFVTNLNTMLFPYVSISLYTSDKRIYLADASAKRYRPSAYYCAKVLATFPFSLVCTVSYSGILYGLSGLRHGEEYFARYTCVVTLFYLIACQVLHLSAVVMPNQDATFALSIIWCTVQVLCSSFYITFSQVALQWLTQLRYISALYFAQEALMQNEMRGGMVDCSSGLNKQEVDMLTAGVVNMSPLHKAVLNQLKAPQPGCMFREDALLMPMGFHRSYGLSIGILISYLGILHVLTYSGLLIAVRRERR